jgi:hypothetical protein
VLGSVGHEDGDHAAARHGVLDQVATVVERPLVAKDIVLVEGVLAVVAHHDLDIGPHRRLVPERDVVDEHVERDAVDRDHGRAVAAATPFLNPVDERLAQVAQGTGHAAATPDHRVHFRRGQAHQLAPGRRLTLGGQRTQRRGALVRHRMLGARNRRLQSRASSRRRFALQYKTRSRPLPIKLLVGEAVTTPLLRVVQADHLANGIHLLDDEEVPQRLLGHEGCREIPCATGRASLGLSSRTTKLPCSTRLCPKGREAWLL